MFQFVLGFSAGAALASFLIKGSVITAVHGESLSPPRKRVYSHLLANVHGPDQLRKMAGLFDAEGHKAEAKVLKSKAKQVDAQAMIAEDWAKRARAGDQNAMASIAACRQSAEAGNERARVSCWLISRWLDAHPMPGEVHGDDIEAHGDEVHGDEPDVHGEETALHGAFDAGVEPPPEVQPAGG